MKNVIVFALAGARWAIELRWVREVFTLGPVTPVPTAPGAIAGVVNFHGGIVPLLDVLGLVGEATRGAPRGGEPAILIDVEGARAGLRVEAIEEVSTLEEAGAGTLVDSRGREVTLVDPPALVVAALAAVSAAARLDEAEE